MRTLAVRIGEVHLAQDPTQRRQRAGMQEEYSDHRTPGVESMAWIPSEGWVTTLLLEVAEEGREMHVHVRSMKGSGNFSLAQTETCNALCALPHNSSMSRLRKIYFRMLYTFGKTIVGSIRRYDLWEHNAYAIKHPCHFMLYFYSNSWRRCWEKLWDSSMLCWQNGID